jgi:hypothetical protein
MIPFSKVETLDSLFHFLKNRSSKESFTNLTSFLQDYSKNTLLTF